MLLKSELLKDVINLSSYLIDPEDGASSDAKI